MNSICWLANGNVEAQKENDLLLVQGGNVTNVSPQLESKWT